MPLQLLDEVAHPPALAVQAGQVVGDQGDHIGVTQALLQSQPARPVVDRARRLVPFGIDIPFGRPAMLLADALDVGLLALRAVLVVVVARERLADVAQGDGAFHWGARLARHDQTPCVFGRCGQTVSERPPNTLESLAVAALPYLVHRPERRGIVGTLALTFANAPSLAPLGSVVNRVVSVTLAVQAVGQRPRDYLHEGRQPVNHFRLAVVRPQAQAHIAGEVL